MTLRWDNPASSVGIQTNVLAIKVAGADNLENLSLNKRPAVLFSFVMI